MSDRAAWDRHLARSEPPLPFLPNDYELTDDDRKEAAQLAERVLASGPLAQIVRAETMNVLKTNARLDQENAATYELLFEEIKQEALDAERSADRPLGIRGRVRAWYRTHRDWSPRGALQRLPHMVRRLLASLPRS